MAKPNRSTSAVSDAADAEKTADLRAAEAEMASRKTAADAAAANVARLQSIADAEAAALVPAVAAVAVTPVVAWTPAEAMSADAVRTAVASFGRSVINLAARTTQGPPMVLSMLGAVGELLGAFEPNQLSTLIGAMERSGGLKAAPRHNADCVEYAEFLAMKKKPANCVAGCPMVGWKPATVGAPRAASTPSTSGTATGRSIGNVAYNGATNPTASVSCKQAAILAAVDYPNSAILTKAIAATGEQNFRKILIRAIVSGQVPAGTFGETIVKEITPADEADAAAGAAATTPPTPPTADQIAAAA